MMSTLMDLARLVDPYMLGAVLACVVCALSAVAALRALPGRQNRVATRLSTPPTAVRVASGGFWSYRVTEARD